MRFLLSFACVVVYCATTNGLTIPDDMKEKYIAVKTECLAEVPGVNHEHLQKMKKEHEFDEDDEDLKKYVLCFHVKCGFIKESGEYNVTHMKEQLAKIVGNHDHDKDLDECTKEDHHDAIQNAWAFVKCASAKLPSIEED